MSELSILELETEHAELLPEREALSLVHGFHVGGGNSVHVTQVAIANAGNGGGGSQTTPMATSTNTLVIAVG
jgi:1,4-dihydroxy-2-naphthoyl-CoA synthase